MQTGGIVLRKILIGILIGVFLTMVGVAFGAEKPIKIILDGKEISTDVPPQIINDRTFVPIRVVSESLGINVKWDSANRTVILTSPGNMPEFSVISYNKIDNEYGYVILGEVKNQSKKTFSKVELKGEILDSGGNVIERLSTTLPSGITPGETAYFRLRSFSDKKNQVSTVNFSSSTSDECSVTPTDVVFGDVRFSKDPGIYNDFTYVSGEIERTDNDFTRTYNHPLVQIAEFDKNGKMVNYGEKNLDSYTNSRYKEFKITLDKGPDYSSYKLKLFSD